MGGGICGSILIVEKNKILCFRTCVASETNIRNTLLFCLTLFKKKERMAERNHRYNLRGSKSDGALTKEGIIDVSKLPEWAVLETGYTNFPLEMDVDIFPNLHLVDRKSDGTRIDTAHVNKTHKWLLSKANEMIELDLLPGLTPNMLWSDYKDFVVRKHLPIVGSVLEYTYKKVDPSIKDNPASKLSQENKIKAWDRCKKISDAIARKPYLSGMFEELPKYIKYTVDALFRVDYVGNVVSLYAKNGSLCFIEYDHIFPLSRGGRTNDIRGTPKSNIECLQHTANTIKNDEFLQLIDPSSLRVGLSPKKLVMGLRYKAIMHSMNVLEACLGYNPLMRGCPLSEDRFLPITAKLYDSKEVDAVLTKDTVEKNLKRLGVYLNGKKGELEFDRFISADSIESILEKGLSTTAKESLNDYLNSDIIKLMENEFYGESNKEKKTDYITARTKIAALCRVVSVALERKNTEAEAEDHQKKEENDDNGEKQEKQQQQQQQQQQEPKEEAKENQEEPVRIPEDSVKEFIAAVRQFRDKNAGIIKTIRETGGIPYTKVSYMTAKDIDNLIVSDAFEFPPSVSDYRSVRALVILDALNDFIDSNADGIHDIETLASIVSKHWLRKDAGRTRNDLYLPKDMTDVEKKKVTFGELAIAKLIKLTIEKSKKRNNKGQ